MSREMLQQLEAVGSTWRHVFHEDHPDPKLKGQHVCYLEDRVSGHRWHSATGTDSKDALNNALTTARFDLRPKNTGEAMQRAAELENENADLKAKLAALMPAEPPKTEPKTEVKTDPPASTPKLTLGKPATTK